MAIGGTSLRWPSRRANITPMSSTVTVQPSASARARNQSRTCLSRSVSVSRQMPPFGRAADRRGLHQVAPQALGVDRQVAHDGRLLWLAATWYTPAAGVQRRAARRVCAVCRVVRHLRLRDTVIGLAGVPPHDIVRLRMIQRLPGTYRNGRRAATAQPSRNERGVGACTPKSCGRGAWPARSLPSQPWRDWRSPLRRRRRRTCASASSTPTAAWRRSPCPIATACSSPRTRSTPRAA